MINFESFDKWLNPGLNSFHVPFKKNEVQLKARLVVCKKMMENQNDRGLAFSILGRISFTTARERTNSGHS